MKRRSEARSSQTMVNGVIGGSRSGWTHVAATLNCSSEAGWPIQWEWVVGEVVAVVFAVGVDRTDDRHPDTAGRHCRRWASAAATPYQFRARARHTDVDAARAWPSRRVLRRVAVHSQIAATSSHYWRRTSTGTSQSWPRLRNAAIWRLARRPTDAGQVRAGHQLTAVCRPSVVCCTRVVHGDGRWGFRHVCVKHGGVSWRCVATDNGEPRPAISCLIAGSKKQRIYSDKNTCKNTEEQQLLEFISFTHIGNKLIKI